ncbi:Protein vip1 [Blastocladiella emersonii ATCC 22665]|nr:Protein vip1 [Blastocladiella emersonii ATCC 22665]
MTTFNVADIEATPNAVLVQNISANATEKSVKDFFSFCGKINRFEMLTSGETQEAFILFDKESAANTARLLSNAVIVDRSVTVKSFFEAHESDAAVAVEEDAKKAIETNDDEHKPYTRVIAELLAEGYTLSETIVKRGVEIDDKYSVTKTLAAYMFSARAKAEALDEQYKVTNLLKEMDAKFHISENATQILAKTKELGEKALATPTGQKVFQTVDAAKDRALEVAAETRQIVEEKKSA